MCTRGPRRRERARPARTRRRTSSCCRRTGRRGEERRASMVSRSQLYKCDVCGNIVEVAHVGGGTLVCCGQPMRLLTENTVDAAKEKHVPVVEKTAGGFLVKVGA